MAAKTDRPQRSPGNNAIGLFLKSAFRFEMFGIVPKKFDVFRGNNYYYYLASVQKASNIFKGEYSFNIAR